MSKSTIDSNSKIIANIKLSENEQKSIRNKKYNLTEAYCFIQEDTFYISSLKIDLQKNNDDYLYDSSKDRKLYFEQGVYFKMKKIIKTNFILPNKIFIDKNDNIKIEFYTKLRFNL